MTINVKDLIPTNLRNVALYEEMINNIQFILGNGEVKLSTSYANAVANAVIDITGVGSGTHTLVSSLSNKSDNFTVDVSTDLLTLESFLDLEIGTRVRVSSTGTLPTGLAADTDYYVAKTASMATYSDIRDKYKDFLSLDNEIVQKIISEQGYDYIVDVLQLLVSGNIESKIFLGYIGLIHFLKGHRRGLELVFGLLNIDYTLTEWWEKTPQGTPDTFDLTIDVDMANSTFDWIDSMDTAIKAFVARYVYPIFDNYIINATLKVQSPFYIGVIGLYGEEIKVLPPIILTVTVQSPFYIGIILLNSETITVYPA